MISLIFKSNKKTKTSLRNKLEDLHRSLQNRLELKDLPDFFNLCEDFFKNLSKKEREQMPAPLLAVEKTTARTPYGMFRAEEGRLADQYNTYVAPKGHFDEFFYTKTVAELISNPGKPSRFSGFASRDMTLPEFYHEAFSKPFVVDKLRAIQLALKKLS